MLLWRAGLRISQALALKESDLDSGRGAVLVRRGKGGKRREVGMDRWASEQLEPWLEIRRTLPIGAVLCVIHGPTAGRRWEASAARKQLHHAVAAASVRRRFAPHQLRHAHAVEMAHEGVPLVVIQRRRLTVSSSRSGGWGILIVLALASFAGRIGQTCECLEQAFCGRLVVGD